MIGKLNEEKLCSGDKDSFWLMGLVAADGYITRNGKAVSIGQSGDKGKELLEDIKNRFGIKNSITSYQPKGHENASRAYEIQFTSERLTSWYEQYGIVENKTLELELPDFESETDFRCFVRGYLDGDGCVGVYENGHSTDYPRMSVYGNEGFIEPLNKTVPVEGKTAPQKKGKQVCWNGRKARSFGRWLFQDEDLINTAKSDLFWNKLDTWECMFDEDPFEEEKKRARKLLEEGQSPRHFGDDFSASVSTIYSWKSKWEL